MPSQSNSPEPGKMRIALTSDGPRVEAVDTLRLVWNAFALCGDFALTGLFASAPGSAWFIAPPELADAYTEGPIAAIPANAERLDNLAVSQVAATATAAGCATSVLRLWVDGIGGTFASEPRLIEALHVVEPWQYIRIEPSPDSGGHVSRAVVGAGAYLVFSTGTKPQARAVCQVAEVPDHEAIAAIDGFAADRMGAVCGRCGRHWSATSGSTLFQGAQDLAPSWRFDPEIDLGHATGTIACPVSGCSGRVRFNARIALRD
jgi:hypothetical protein